MSIRSWQVCVQQLSPFSAAEQVLDHFRNRFSNDVDASDIVTELERKTIILSSDRMRITSSPNRIQQNQILYKCLRRRCTKEALMAVCEVIITVQSNPRMKGLGKDMKRVLEGKCCVCSCLCAFMTWCTCTPQTTSSLSTSTTPEHPACQKYRRPFQAKH